MRYLKFFRWPRWRFFQAGGGADGAEELTEEEGREILEMKNSSNIYTDMVNSIAPTVFGHSEVPDKVPNI